MTDCDITSDFRSRTQSN